MVSLLNCSALSARDPFAIIWEAQYLLGHDDIKTTLDTYTHFGFADVQVDKLEDYYNAVKMQSNEKVIPLKHA